MAFYFEYAAGFDDVGEVKTAVDKSHIGVVLVAVFLVFLALSGRCRLHLGVGLRVADGDGIGCALLGCQYGTAVELLWLRRLLRHLLASLFIGLAFALRARSECTSSAELREEGGK